MKIYSIGDHCSALGEGPLWDERTNSILWVDILNSKVLSLEINTQKILHSIVGDQISAIAKREQGGYIAAARDGIGYLDLENNNFKYLAELEKELTFNRFNDGKCDPLGRFWAGTMNEVDANCQDGKLYALTAQNTVKILVSDVGCSNGLAWSLDHSTLYYIDSICNHVVAFDYDMHLNAISNKRVVITIPTADGIPDGMTIDQDGMLWIACWNGWQVCRYNPIDGNLLARIELPVSQVSSCAFGGSDYSQLYITTASVGLKDKDLAKQPLAGSLFVVDACGTKGFASVSFKG